MNDNQTTMKTTPEPLTLEDLSIPSGANKTSDSALRPYIALYKGKKVQVLAPSSYEAQTLGARALKAKKAYEVSVYLADIVHSTEEV